MNSGNMTKEIVGRLGFKSIASALSLQALQSCEKYRCITQEEV